MRKRLGLDKANTQKWIFLFIAIVPPFGGYLLFTLFPNILSIYYAMLNWDGFTDATFVGLSNFVTAFQDKYVWRALTHNLIFMITVPFFVIVISLLLAYLITNKTYKEINF